MSGNPNGLGWIWLDRFRLSIYDSDGGAKTAAEQVVKNGAGWFLAIAGLSILNSVLTMRGTNFHFIFGPGVTEIVDTVGRQSSTTGSALGLVVNLFVAGLFLLFWNFARQGEKWAFLVGIALYRRIDSRPLQRLPWRRLSCIRIVPYLPWHAGSSCARTSAPKNGAGRRTH